MNLCFNSRKYGVKVGHSPFYKKFCGKTRQAIILHFTEDGPVFCHMSCVLLKPACRPLSFSYTLAVQGPLAIFFPPLSFSSDLVCSCSNPLSSCFTITTTDKSFSMMQFTLIVCYLLSPESWDVIPRFQINRGKFRITLIDCLLHQRAIMDFNGNLLIRCGKTYRRAFLSWIAGMALSMK